MSKRTRREWRRKIRKLVKVGMRFKKQKRKACADLDELEILIKKMVERLKGINT